jgi:hypothetical protein
MSQLPSTVALCPRSRREVQTCERQRHPRYAPRSSFQKVFVPADGVKAANYWSGDIGTSPFWGSSSDKSVLAPSPADGDAGDKAQWCVKELIRG